MRDGTPTRAAAARYQSRSLSCVRAALAEALEPRRLLSGAITGLVITDQDSDGVFDFASEDSHRSSAIVQLWKSFDAIVGNADDTQVGQDRVTSWNGQYAFTDLASGAYYVRFARPEGGFFSPKGIGSDETLDSDADPATGCTDLISLAEDQVITDCNALVYQLAHLAGRVTLDHSGNVAFDESDTPVGGVVVSLYEYIGGSDTQPIGELIAQTTTDSAGNYAFANLKPRAYHLTFGSLDGMVLGLVGSARPNTLRNYQGISHVFGVLSGQQLEQNALLVRASSIRGLAWQDSNGDGLRQVDEPPLTGVTARLFRCESVWPQSSDPQIGSDIQTDSSGRYLFPKLPWGDYYVRLLRPPGLTFSPPHIGADDTIDSDIHYEDSLASAVNQPFYLGIGQDFSTLDAGFTMPGSLGGIVWHDVNRNGVRELDEPGLGGVPVTLQAPPNGWNGWWGRRNVGFAYTDANGQYRFDGLPPEQYIVHFGTVSSYCFFSAGNQGTDDSIDSDVTHSDTIWWYGETDPIITTAGQQILTIDAALNRPAGAPTGISLSAPSDTGISNTDRLTNLDNSTPDRRIAFQVQGTTPGAQVILLADGVQLIGTGIASGATTLIYSDGVTDLADGPHEIRAMQVPPGYSWSNPSYPVTITVDTSVPTADIVDVQPDPRDTPISEAVVSFSEDVFGSPSAASFSLTREGGKNLLQGVSSLVITRVDGRSFKLSAAALAYHTGLAGSYLFSFDSSTSTLTDAAGNRVITPASDAFAIENLAGIKPTVWTDYNFDGIRDAAEPVYGYSFTVSLYDSVDGIIGNEDDSRVASGSPNATFLGLRPGQYYAVFSAPSSDLIFTLPNVGSDELLDSDADRSTGRTGLFTLESGQILTSITAGVFSTSFFTQSPSTFTLSRQGDRVQIVEAVPRMSDRIRSAPLEMLPSLTIKSAGSESTVRIDLSGGNPIPAGGLTYSSTTWAFAKNSIELLGHGANVATYLPGPPPAGQSPSVSQLVVDGRPIELIGRPDVLVSNFASLTTTLPAGASTYQLNTATPGRSTLTPVNSTLAVSPLHVSTVSDWLLDLASSDTSPLTDTLTIQGGATPGFGKLRAVFDGGLDSLTASSGTTNLEILGSAALAVSGTAIINLSGSPMLNSISVRQQSLLKAIGDGSQVLRTANLSITDAAALDLGVGNLIVDTPSESAASAVCQNITQAIRLAGPTWQSRGLTSSAAAAHRRTTLAAMPGGTLRLFAGQVVDASSVLVKYTWNGDVNLDGVVDAADYFLVDSGFLTQQGGYRNGDLNFDNIVDAADYFLIDSAFIAQTGVLAASEPTPRKMPAVVSAQLPTRNLLIALEADNDLHAIRYCLFNSQ